MIPKIIHYTWFSNDPYPDKILNCMESWKKFLPDYEFCHWDMDSIADIDSDFLREAISVKKWAYAADYVRLYAIYNYGGIYLDTDVLLYKGFNDLLSCSAFIGKEVSTHIGGSKQEMYLSAHCFGAEKNNEFIADCLRYFNGRKFILSNEDNLPASLKYNQVLLPYIQSEIAKLYGYDPKPLSQDIQNLTNVTIYPSVYFDSEKNNKKAYCRHLAMGSWRESSYNKTQKITLGYKISWRLRSVFENLAKLFNYKLIKLK
ncbi:MAG: glycosyl transferase [Muribaculum sp.]|nr:glycosyl transferase [Muribaculum sp.]